MPRVVIAGGGTGGHVFPAIAIARELRARLEGDEILMVGTERGIEMRAVPAAGFRLETIPVGGLRGKSLVRTALNASRLPRALLASWSVLRRHRPGVVIGVGGYASGPVVAAAALRRLPTLIHEQNLVPGSTNRWLAPFVGEVAVTFDETRRRLGGRGTVTGNPVRPEFARIAPRARGRKSRHLLIFGGSQGAAPVNRAVADALEGLRPTRDRLRVVHQTGEADADRMREAYERAGIEARVVPFIDAMWKAVEEADLVVARAGATTVAELTAAGRGAVLVPLPQAIHDHQTFNARTLESAGAAVLVPQAGLTGAGLASLLVKLLGDEERLDAMSGAARRLGRPEAASRIADMALKIARPPAEEGRS